MKSVDNTLVEVQDGLCDLKRQIGSLKDMTFVLQSGFEKINDDNSNFIISCLRVLEAQLSYMNEDVSKEIQMMDFVLNGAESE